MPSPLVHSLAPVTLLLPFRRNFRFLAIAAGISNLPDLDLIPAYWMVERYSEIHRNWGHNIFSLFLLSALGAYVLKRWGGTSLRFKRAYLISTILISGHLFLDSLQHFDYAPEDFSPDLPLFWPVSRWTFSLPLRIFGTPAAIFTLQPDRTFLDISLHFVALEIAPIMAIAYLVAAANRTYLRAKRWAYR